MFLVEPLRQRSQESARSPSVQSTTDSPCTLKLPAVARCMELRSLFLTAETPCFRARYGLTATAHRLEPHKKPPPWERPCGTRSAQVVLRMPWRFMAFSHSFLSLLQSHSWLNKPVIPKLSTLRRKYRTCQHARAVADFVSANSLTCRPSERS